MFCEAIFGLFCFAAPIGHSTVDIQNMGFGGVASLSEDGWTALLDLGSDVFIPLNPTKLAQHCEGNVCVRYWRHCVTATDGKIDCEFSFDERYTSLSLRVVADSKEALDRALPSIGLLTDRTKPDGAIAMSLLNVESPIPDVPECRYPSDGKPDKGCPATQPSP
jgi:hypothetical protein